MKPILLFFTYFCLLRLPEEGITQQQPSPSVVLNKLPSVKRVTVISPRELSRLDPRVPEMINALSSPNSTGRPRPKVTPTKENRSRFDRLQSGEKPTQIKLPYSDTQLRMLGESVFISTLRSLAQERLKASTPPQEELQKQLVNAKAEGGEDLDIPSLGKVADALDCELLLLPQHCSVEVIDRTERVVVFRAEMVAQTYTLGGQKPYNQSRFPIAGTSASTRSVVFGEYGKTLPQMVAESATIAAKRVVHALQWNELPPFLLPRVRFALAPVISLPNADRLLFTPDGRKTLLNDITTLPREVSEMFSVHIPPLFADSFLETRVVKRKLQELGERASNLWVDSERPNTELIRTLGAGLEVDYLLLVHITDLEGYGAVPKPTESSVPAGSISPKEMDGGVVFQARAVAFGALVRVKDGTILWKDRSDVVMSLRQENLSLIHPISEQKMIQNSIRFALMGLERSFTRYGVSFEH